jgi:hypothetical protein
MRGIEAGRRIFDDHTCGRWNSQPCRGRKIPFWVWLPMHDFVRAHHHMGDG